MDEKDGILQSIEKVLTTRNLTPSQQALMLKYKDSLNALRKDRALSVILRELFKRHIMSIDKDFYGEENPKYNVSEPNPLENDQNREVVGISKFLPGWAIDSDFFIEPPANRRWRYGEVEL